MGFYNEYFLCIQWVIVYIFIIICDTAESDETYMGYDRWLPSPPKVVKPRSVFNAASLAYIGDCIYEVCSDICLVLVNIFMNNHN